jgi:hypothetical protein
VKERVYVMHFRCISESVTEQRYGPEDEFVEVSATSRAKASQVGRGMVGSHGPKGKRSRLCEVYAKEGASL